MECFVKGSGVGDDWMIKLNGKHLLEVIDYLD